MNRKRKLGFCYPGYRYCGPGCSGPGEPTNAVDACCKLHDECYTRHGSTRHCDEQFQRCLQPYMNAPNKMARDARLFYRVFDLRNRYF
ncbi:Parvovirus coat protein VP1-like protein [Lysinibacillus irui]|uniref:Parvovirus coat protein VP1-like protein n=1 Tax=Lysinibacillus irui TaxID=2998077 RepID=A0AAJ5UUL7_9BACI|nr:MULTISPECIES: Parvovirus coat protein VP1-like protein [Lysinibacillus]MEA0551995.1 Parvovirus coat protein VP1-like protein [Lysinibacillus irui]MEA0563351.1 Parvovirus coat protein VP1-like protein [Lysinibacillus irui]MEA0977920.1 Parvovirus coat protein VP1-like protein [Lysinibacillus irui]MEA1044074.1 Parvovirus coat protein VP1-like protein [Lysinibacillus irui]WDV08034.1 Parvovirus coat protein VP1-like protein [Lysinibacillus irui]